MVPSLEDTAPSPEGCGKIPELVSECGTLFRWEDTVIQVRKGMVNSGRSPGVMVLSSEDTAPSPERDGKNLKEYGTKFRRGCNSSESGMAWENSGRSSGVMVPSLEDIQHQVWKGMGKFWKKYSMVPCTEGRIQCSQLFRVRKGMGKFWKGFRNDSSNTLEVVLVGTVVALGQ
ncbi:hypothetical protein OG21DRAFT_1524369 [Imleria badia]|nr:hypothetical protein OG21DRAFT_1524369 [Imleria badia]